MYARAAITLLLVANVVRAEEISPEADLSRKAIGLIDMAKVFQGSREYRQRSEELRAKVAARVDAARPPQAPGVQSKLTAFWSKELAKEESIIYRDIYEDVQAKVRQIAEEKHLSLVIRYSNDEITDADEPQAVIEKLNRLVVFRDEELDITDLVIERLNADGRGSDEANDENEANDGNEAVNENE